MGEKDAVTVLLEEECEECAGGRFMLGWGIGGEGDAVDSSGFAMRNAPNDWDKLISPPLMVAEYW